MGSNPNKSWNTKYGPRRVRYEAPGLDEAIAAARDLTDRLDEQADIAASLIGVPREVVMAELKKTVPQQKGMATVTLSSRDGAQRTVVVQRKPARRLAAATPPGRLRAN